VAEDDAIEVSDESLQRNCAFVNNVVGVGYSAEVSNAVQVVEGDVVYANLAVQPWLEDFFRAVASTRAAILIIE
jgi:hypothetical protein